MKMPETRLMAEVLVVTRLGDDDGAMEEKDDSIIDVAGELDGDTNSRWYQNKANIFACDEWAVYSSQKVQVVEGALESAVVDSDLKCEMGGEFGTALNTEIFFKVWDKVYEDKRYLFHEWIVKVDPDSAFFVDRLRVTVAYYHDIKGGIYFNNCKFGMHGPIEVFSQNAVEAWRKGRHHCDMFIDQCLMKVLDVKRVNDWNLISEAHCDSPDWPECRNGRVCFHPFKDLVSYKRCMANATAKGWSAGERFPPKACLEPCVGGAEQLPKSGCMFHPVLGTALFAAMRARACAHTRHRGIGRLRGPSPHLRKDATRGHECGRRLQYQVSFNLANAKSDKAMKDRVNENQQMRRRLENELRETCNQINMTKNTIQDTKHQIRSLEEPMEMCSTCASWRKQRATKESRGCREDLRQHHQNEKSVLQELNEKKDQLKEDLRDKTSALHIDLNCLTHEATSLNGKPSPAISRNRLPKAMKVDPSFVPNPGHTMMVQMPLTAR
eukprot:s42_g12.t1